MFVKFIKTGFLVLMEHPMVKLVLVLVNALLDTQVITVKIK